MTTSPYLDENDEPDNDIDCDVCEKSIECKKGFYDCSECDVDYHV